MAPRYNPYAQTSGTDSRGRLQNQGAYQQQRYESQQGPLANQFAYQTGRSNEADYGNYTNMMNMYQGIASGANSGGPGRSSSGGSGTGGTYTPFLAGYKDPFNSYAGFTEFSTTGGYSPEDIANMRARGISPIRAAYANAERELQRGRSLQGGYSPNMAAAQVKMAREQGQSAADATQNVEAGLAEARNRGRLAGLTGMSGIEGQRLSADVDISKFNANQQSQAQAANIGARRSAGASSSAAKQAGVNAQLDALSGMRSLYGTTPGMSQMFGNQAINTVGQGGNYGLGVRGQDRADQGIPGQYDTTMSRIRDIGGLAGQGLNVWNEINSNRRRQRQP
jgi:hypothetical protein